MIRKSLLLAPSLLLLLTTSGYAVDGIDNGLLPTTGAFPIRVATDLKSTDEVPVISSLAATGRFKATIDEANLSISYELTYTGLEGAPLAAHLHVGQAGVNGAIPLFLCANAPALPPAGSAAVQACPPAPATITGTLTPTNIIPRPAQGIDAVSPEDFVELMRLMLAGQMYANVHTTKYMGGEIRGQVRRDGLLVLDPTGPISITQ